MLKGKTSSVLYDFIAISSLVLIHKAVHEPDTEGCLRGSPSLLLPFLPQNYNSHGQQ